MRSSKLVSVQEAVEKIKDGGKVAIGGMWYHNRPIGLVYEMIRQKKMIGELSTSPAASYDIDLLLASNLVKKLRVPNVTFERMGIAPFYRYAIEQGIVEFVETDESTLIGSYMAAVEGIPFHPIGSLKATDLLYVKNLVKTINVDGERIPVVESYRPDVAIIHVQEADIYGNCLHDGSIFADQLLARTARYVIVQCDCIITNDEVRRESFKTTIPGFYVDSVVHVPFGAHPCSSHGKYMYDKEVLTNYLSCAKLKVKGDSHPFEEFVSYWIDIKDRSQYLEHIDYNRLRG